MRKVCATVILFALVGICTGARAAFDDDDVPKPANPAGPPGRMDLQAPPEEQDHKVQQECRGAKGDTGAPRSSRSARSER